MASISSLTCRSVSFTGNVRRGGPADSEKAAKAACFQESAGGPDAYVIGIVADTRHHWNRELDYFGRSQDGTHSSRDQRIHLGINAFISGPMHSSQDQCIHLRTNAFISGSMHSSRDQRSHLGINALISGSTLSSRDQRSHLGINALISGSMLSSRDQCSHLRIKPLTVGGECIQRNVYAAVRRITTGKTRKGCDLCQIKQN